MVKCQMCSIPVGANFRIIDDDYYAGKVYVRIPEMLLHLPGSVFVVNCIYEKDPMNDFEPVVAVADFISLETECEYWWPNNN